jgi:tRNA modification GTPase
MPESPCAASETIVAISTPPGRGGIGIVRLSGPRAAEIGAGLVRLRDALQYATACLADVVDGELDERIDQALVTWFQAPRSYTGEDVVEIAAHGSPVVLEALVRQALELGAQLASPGEFTQRAFLSGRIDLTQAEAVRDLIEAQTLAQARLAASQMGGALSRRVHPVKDELLELIALLEAGIDFAEDDLEVAASEEILSRMERVEAPLAALGATFRHGRVLHDGLTMAIVGRPNAGKSSLFNALVERDRAIVTAIPGTTRDVVSERVAIGGIPLELVDTAGLREAVPEMDEAERLGMARSRTALAEATLVLLVVDATLGVCEEDRALLAELEGRAAILVRNKADLLAEDTMAESVASIRCGDGDEGEKQIPFGNDKQEWGRIPCVLTSAVTGAGVEELRRAIVQLATGGAAAESGMLTTLRHRQSVETALAALADARRAVADGTPHEMVLLDLYRALWALDALTGQTTTDDVLQRIFSTFCIGK